MARILIVDDDEEVVGTVYRSLRHLNYEVVTAFNGQSALRAISETSPDLVILDIMMPQMDGLEVCRKVRSQSHRAATPILFLTARGRLEDKIEGFHAGADDYLTKPFDIEELELRVRALLRRAMVPEPTISESQPALVRVGNMALNPRTYEVTIKNKTILLTPVEFDLLHYLMSHANEVISSERLLQEVWNYPPGTGAPDLVRVHIKNLREKIEPSPKAPIYIQTVSRHGYTIRPSDIS
ncbi:MAG: response regulator transcription factor [Chloroflexi bacterium]|nr:response regulator transcription factor [Chloroflexota bacterium]